MSTDSIKFGNYCLEEAFGDPDVLVRRAERALAMRGIGMDQFSTVVGTGFSGALVVPLLGRAWDKDYLLTRKPGDSHHHGNAIAEGSMNRDGKWIFADDGIGTGTTYRRIRHQVNQLAIGAGIPDKFAGAYLYGHGAMSPPDFWTPDMIYQRGVRL